MQFFFKNKYTFTVISGNYIKKSGIKDGFYYCNCLFVGHEVVKFTKSF